MGAALSALGLADGYAATETAALRLADEVRDLVTGKEGALRAALSAAPSTYMHHVLWPRSPYLLIVTSRAWILARINRAALAQGTAGGGGGQTIHLCWQSPVVTPAVLDASKRSMLVAVEAELTASKEGAAPSDSSSPAAGSSEASFGGSPVATSTGEDGAEDAASVGIQPASSTAPAAAGRPAGAARGSKKGGRSGVIARSLAGLGAAVRDLDAAGVLASAATQRSRAAAPVGVQAGHCLFAHLQDSMSSACIDAAAAIESTANLRAAMLASIGTGQFVPVVSQKRRGELLLSSYGVRQPSAATGTGVGGPEAGSARLQVRTGPAALMAYDAYVQKRMMKLSGFSPEEPLFGLPRRLVDSMLVFTDPLPLHWGDAIATLANIRPDEAPARNVGNITAALGFMDRAYVKYCKERSDYLLDHPDAPGAGEAEALARQATIGLETDDIIPLFNFCVSKALIDRPVLCAVLARTWLEQQGAVTTTTGVSSLELRQATLGSAASQANAHYYGPGGKSSTAGLGVNSKGWAVEAFALAMFKSATEWAAAVSFPGSGK